MISGFLTKIIDEGIAYWQERIRSTYRGHGLGSVEDEGTLVQVQRCDGLIRDNKRPLTTYVVCEKLRAVCEVGSNVDGVRSIAKVYVHCVPDRFCCCTSAHSRRPPTHMSNCGWRAPASAPACGTHPVRANTCEYVLQGCSGTHSVKNAVQRAPSCISVTVRLCSYLQRR